MDCKADFLVESAFLLVLMDEILLHNPCQRLENHFRDFPLGSTLLGFGNTLQMLGE
jgi:hypothetical protein